MHPLEAQYPALHTTAPLVSLAYSSQREKNRQRRIQLCVLSIRSLSFLFLVRRPAQRMKRSTSGPRKQEHRATSASLPFSRESEHCPDSLLPEKPTLPRMRGGARRIVYLCLPGVRPLPSDASEALADRIRASVTPARQRRPGCPFCK